MKNLATLRSSFTRILGGLSFLAGMLTASTTVHAAPPPGVLNMDHPGIQTVKALQDRVTPEVMSWPSVLGTAIGLSDNDAELALVVYVERDGPSVAEVVRAFPPRLLGTAVRIELTEKFSIRAGKPGGPGKPGGGGGSSLDHKGIQSQPIRLGTSGGWSFDLANGYCCGGTLGSLVEIGGVQHIMSNYHVLEADIAGGGNGRTAQTGDPVIQPGLIDVGCDADSAQHVGTLVLKHSLPMSNVDVSVARVIDGAVSADGAILGIGTLSSQTVGASLNQPVKKSGRTTGLTRSKVSGLNASVSVTYDDECAGGTAFTKTYTGQIVISNRRSGFLAGGDSGSLMVEDVESNPRAVGLLYAGSSTSAIANPIGQVLEFLNATMVGN
ncbi:MAG: hypothetical protein AB7J34_16585 [Limisphaerales bacterium]